MRIVGIENEYGIVHPDDPRANPIALSAGVVAASRRRPGVPTVHWDYGGEDPLLDQRGTRRPRASATDAMLTDQPRFDGDTAAVTLRRRRGSWEDPAHLNAVLTNGARFYVDHAHPEYSGPEVASAKDAVIWDKAGDAIALAACAQFEHDNGHPVTLYKNNVDGKGASYGTHENYLVNRDTDFDQLARRLTAHLVTRQVFTGAGRVGLGQQGEEPGFQLSQRADYIEAPIGLETTLRRPIINTRDEPHADRRRWRRLHIIIGDANHFEMATFLKVGSTSLVLSAIEADDERLDAIVLADPVADVQRVSRDVHLTRELALDSGEGASALDIQRALIEICRAYVRDHEDVVVLDHWERVTDLLARDIFAASKDVEWVSKLDLLGRLRSRYAHVDSGGTQQLPSWADARLAAADVKWSELGVGYAAALERAGAVTRITTDHEVAHAQIHAPANTRAHVRGSMVATRADIVDAAGWSTVVIDRDTDHGDLEVVHLPDPADPTHPLLEELMRG